MSAGINQGPQPPPRKSICQDSGVGSNYRRAGQGWRREPARLACGCVCACVRVCVCVHSARKYTCSGRFGRQVWWRVSALCIVCGACAVCVIKPAFMFHLCTVCIGAVIYLQVCTYVNVRLCVSATYEYADMHARVCKCAFVLHTQSVGFSGRVCVPVGVRITMHVCFTCSMCVQKQHPYLYSICRHA